MNEFHLPPGTLIAHYRIRSAIGSGGMGEVYLAADERLGRKVALKILPPEFVRDRTRLARFEREAHATSALNHPNILTIYDMGEESGHYFIASEFIEGETLRSRLARRKLKLRDVIEVSTQVAGALSAAHAEGVIHRDIKPENIMIRPDGYVKILDFGLAKLSEEIVWTKEEPESGGATVHRPTDPGVVMGTVQYMSPEQAQGEEVDARSDIFSLGVVMYEMITGHLPFEGATKSHVIVSILEKPPLPLHRSAPETPHELQRIVSKCLSKERDERYQVTKDLLIDLRALRHELEVAADLETRSGEHHFASTPRVSDEHRVQRTSDPQPVVMRASSAEYLLSELKRHKKGTLITTAAIVVIALAALILPTVMREAESGEQIPVAVADFSNQTGQSELDGLSGMLITSLEQSRRLAVMTRSGMFDTLRRLGKENVERIDETLGREICRAENVSALVIASISRFGDLYIVDLKVLDPQKNQYLFAAKEEGKGAESIPSMIDRLSERTRLGLKEKARDVKLSSAKVANVTTTNLEAYHHYFRGQQLINQLKFEEAEEEFRKAVALDPTFALAHYGLAYALGWSGLDEAQEPILKAMQYIEKAPEKERYLIRAEKARFVDRNWGQTIAILKQLLERYPDEKDAIFEIGDLSYHKGDLEAAKTYLTKVLEIDPNSERALQHLVWTFRQSGQNAKMLEYAKRYVERVPSEEAYASLASAHQLSGDLDKGLEVSKRAVELFPAGTDPVVQLVFAYLYKNDYDAAAAEARQMLARERPSSARQAGHRLLAAIHSYRGEYRAAQARLDEAVKLADDAKDETGKGRSIAIQASSLAWSRLDDGEARKLAAKSLELGDALNIFAYGNLFDAYALLRDFESARKIAQEHFSGNPVPLHVLAGLDRLSKGDPSSAIRELENAVRADAANLVAPYFLALAQLEAGQYDQAIDSARRAQRTYVSQGPRQHTYPRTYYLLGKIYERKNDRKAARENYQQFVTLWKHADPDLPELLDAKARLAQLKG